MPRWALAALLAWLGFAMPAHATLDCPAPLPTDPVVANPTTAHAQGLLWKIDKAGVPSSFLYGTIHLADPAVATPSPSVLAALHVSRRFVLEVLFDEATLARVASSMQAAPPGNLGAAAGAALLREAEKRLAAYGVDAASAGRLKPWAAWTTLGLPPGQESTGEPLDLRLLSLAREAGLETFGLESLEEQVAVFDATPLPAQLALLQEALCFPDIQRAELAATVAAWQREDLAWLLALARQSRSPSEQALTRRLLDERNARMAGRLLPRLRDGGLFVAVGAAHLPGDDGLLAHIARAGYSVTRQR